MSWVTSISWIPDVQIHSGFFASLTDFLSWNIGRRKTGAMFLLNYLRRVKMTGMNALIFFIAMFLLVGLIIVMDDAQWTRKK